MFTTDTEANNVQIIAADHGLAERNYKVRDFQCGAQGAFLQTPCRDCGSTLDRPGAAIRSRRGLLLAAVVAARHTVLHREFTTQRL